MCVVSAVGDYWKRDFEKKYPDVFETITTWPIVNGAQQIDISGLATKDDIEQIRKELTALKDLLKAAIKFDEEADQPHCENEDKIALIKKVADMVGVDLKDLDLN